MFIFNYGSAEATDSDNLLQYVDHVHYSGLQKRLFCT